MTLGQLLILNWHHTSAYATSPAVALGESVALVIFSPIRLLGSNLAIFFRIFYDELSYLTLCMILPFMSLGFLLTLLAISGGHFSIFGCLMVDFRPSTASLEIEPFRQELDRLRIMIDDMKSFLRNNSNTNFELQHLAIVDASTDDDLDQLIE